MTTIMANVSPRILSEAGHMFSNSLTDTPCGREGRLGTFKFQVQQIS